MFTPDIRMTRYRRTILIGLMGVTLSSPLRSQTDGPNLGRVASPEEIRRWNLTVFPNGTGLPAGSGSANDGIQVYVEKCQSCHGIKGIGSSADELAGTRHKLTDPTPDKAIGNYWPYATTLFDFIRRSMPLNAPGSLTDHQVYSVTAYLLSLNEIVGTDTVLNSETLPKIRMPNRDGFITIGAP